MSFWKDRFALGSAAVGIGLMVLTLACHINPVGQSVVPRFLFDTWPGLVIFWVLFLTCMPAYIAVLLVVGLLSGSHLPTWVPAWLNLFNLGAVGLQALLYFFIAKALAFGLRKLRQ